MKILFLLASEVVLCLCVYHLGKKLHCERIAGEKDQWGDGILKHKVCLYVLGGDFFNICSTVYCCWPLKRDFFAKAQIGSISREKVPYRDVALFRYDVKMQNLKVVFQLLQLHWASKASVFWL